MTNYQEASPCLRDPHEHADRIAEVVERTWSHAYASDHAHVPLSTVAVLSLLQTPTSGETTAVQEFPRLSSAEFAQLCQAAWTRVVRARPELTPTLYPLVAWLWDNPSTKVLNAAKAVADKAVEAGLLTLTAGQRCRDTDVFGPLLTMLRSDTARQGRGQIYTPACISKLIANMILPCDGESLCEPTAGTGGMLRAVAEAMRNHGRDPSTVTWVAGDIDELAIGCLAVNAILWELGPNVILGVGNTLTEDWVERAVGQRKECMTVAENVRTLSALRHLFR